GEGEGGVAARKGGGGGGERKAVVALQKGTALVNINENTMKNTSGGMDVHAAGCGRDRVGVLGIAYENRARPPVSERGRNKPPQRKHQGGEQAINKPEQDQMELSPGTAPERPGRSARHDATAAPGRDPGRACRSLLIPPATAWAPLPWGSWPWQRAVSCPWRAGPARAARTPGRGRTWALRLRRADRP